MSLRSFEPVAVFAPAIARELTPSLSAWYFISKDWEEFAEPRSTVAPCFAIAFQFRLIMYPVNSLSQKWFHIFQFNRNSKYFLKKDGLSMQKPAKACQISFSTIYAYFKSREALLNQLYHKIQQKFEADALNAFDPNRSFQDGLWLQWVNR